MHHVHTHPGRCARAFGEVPHLAFDGRFDTPGKRLGEGLIPEDSEEVRALLRQAFASRTAAKWEQFLRTQPEAIWERVRSWPEVLEDEQNLINGYVTTVDVPQFGATRTVGNLVTLSATPASVKGAPRARRRQRPDPRRARVLRRGDRRHRCAGAGGARGGVRAAEPEAAGSRPGLIRP